jgi:preprotein translocase subunit SecG
MLLAIEISMIIVSVALIASVVLQSKGAGLGGLTGQESGGVYTARRGIERTLFWVTMALSILFFILAFIAIIISA